MIKLHGQLICASQEELEIVKACLPEHIKLTLQEEGCISFNVIQTINPFIWEVDEVFDSLKTFENHQNRTMTSIWGVKTKKIKRLYEILNDQ